MLEEAACELFLEQGYEATSVLDITRRAGVSRATFFNYVDSKAGLLWASVDDSIAQVQGWLGEALTAAGPGGRASGASAHDTLAGGLRRAAGEMQPGVAVLAFRSAEAMGIGPELLRTGAQRQARLAGVGEEFLRASGLDPLLADVTARAYAGAFFGALEFWAAGSSGAEQFLEVLERALGHVRLADQ